MQEGMEKRYGDRNSTYALLTPEVRAVLTVPFAVNVATLEGPKWPESVATVTEATVKLPASMVEL